MTILYRSSMTEWRRKPPLHLTNKEENMKKIFAFIKSLFDGSALKSWIDEGLVDLSGQGRNKYGK